MATPHIAAEPGQIAPLVLMPGDPKRAARIAAEYFSGVRLVSDVRGIGVWTGAYQGTPITTMASGMGLPSISIYATELYRCYGVQRICRVGTAGGLCEDVRIRDIVVGATAHTNNRISQLLVPDVTMSLAASFDMLRGAVERARSKELRGGAKAHVGALFSSDFFYLSPAPVINALAALGTLAVEMEAAGLYSCALQEGAEALAVCTISDQLSGGAADLSSAERETLFADAVDVALAGLFA